MFNFLKNRVSTEPIPFVKHQNFVESTNKKATNQNKRTCEFHNCTRQVMRLCRWVGLFPVEGLEMTNWKELRFNLRSLYGFYYAATITGQLINTTVMIMQIFNYGLNLLMLTTAMFYINGVVSTTLLFFAARKWPYIIGRISEIEKASRIRISPRSSKTIIVLSFVIIVFGIVEHILSMNYSIRYIKGCHPKYTYIEALKLFLFTKMPYETAKNNVIMLVIQIYLELTGNQATFLWSFIDVLNIGLSIYLIAHFERLNSLVLAGKDNVSTNWRKLREQHAKLVQLVNFINDHFNYFILLSCVCNLYFMCVQLYNTLAPVAFHIGDCDQKGLRDALKSLDHQVYFFFSFAFLMVKTLVLSFLAANVNTIAREPLVTLGEVHSSVYGIEIQRFYRQINYTTIGLSGVFFYVTRGTILKVIGSLVTYELLLIQIDSKEQINSLSLSMNDFADNSTSSL